MGYTHYWYRPTEIDRDTYNAIVFDFGRMLPVLRETGVILADGCGEGDPIIDANDVCFNGPVNCGHPTNHEIALPWPSEHAGGIMGNRDAIDGDWGWGATVQHRCCNGDCSYEGFDFPRTMEPKSTRYEGNLFFECCKTAFRPYDLAVNVFLIIAKHHLKGGFLVNSDGEAAHWFDAKLLCGAHLGYGLDFGLDPRPREMPEPPKPEPKTRWISAADTAKLIRQALKEKFPGIKFSVTSRTYSGGDSVRVTWTDGPTQQQVEEVAHEHQSVRRDESGEILSGGNRFIFCDREISPELEGRAREYVALHYNLEGLEYYQVARYYREAFENPDLIPAPTPTPKPAKQERPTAKAPVPPAPAPTETAQATFLRVRDWSWLRFTAKPADSILSALKAAGWDFSGKRQAWYHKEGATPPACVTYLAQAN